MLRTHVTVIRSPTLRVRELCIIIIIIIFCFDNDNMIWNGQMRYLNSWTLNWPVSDLNRLELTLTLFLGTENHICILTKLVWYNVVSCTVDTWIFGLWLNFSKYLLQAVAVAGIYNENEMIGLESVFCRVASFSSQGPSAQSTYIINTDVVAPGVGILAAWTNNNSPTELSSDECQTEFSFLSGTSMAYSIVQGRSSWLVTGF
jgi:Subtilase family